MTGARTLQISTQSYETVVLFLAVFMTAGGIAGLYLKAFNLAPPFPVLAVHLPVLLLTLPVIIGRFRAALFGVFGALPFAAMALLALASYFWSEDPLLTLSEAIFLLILGVYYGCVAWSYTWQRILSVMWAAMLCVGLLSLFLFFVVPSFGKMSEIFPGALMGIFLEKNAAGQLGVFGALLALARFAVTPEKTISAGLSFLMFTLILVLSTSKTALVAYLIGVSMFFWVFAMRRHPAIVSAMVWITVFGGSAVAFLISTNMTAVFSLLGRNATFTGRADIWRAVKVSLDDRPWLGHGYAAYWEKDSFGTTLPWVIDELKYFPNHAHNSWVETSLGLGSLGSYILTAMVVVGFVFAFGRLRSSNGAYFAIPFLTAAVIIGSFESVLAYPANFAGGILLLVAAKVVKSPFPEERSKALQNLIYALSHKVRFHFGPAATADLNHRRA